MGLIKQIELENGTIVNYHRIVSLNKITNKSNIIETASYTSKEKREEEKEAIEKQETMNIYIDTNYITKEYNEIETISDAYGYLKNMEKYSNSIDD